MPELQCTHPDFRYFGSRGGVGRVFHSVLAVDTNLSLRVVPKKEPFTSSLLINRFLVSSEFGRA